MKQYKLCFDDALNAVEMDEKYVKAYLVLGESSIELGKTEETIKSIDKGITWMRKAFSLCTGNQTRQFEDHITGLIYKALKIRYYKMKEFEENEKMCLLQDLKTKVQSNNSAAGITQDTYSKFEKYLTRRTGDDLSG